MTTYRPTSNTIVTIPTSALKPTEGVFYPLQADPVSSNLFTELVTNGRAGLFVNPVSGNIALTSAFANNLISVISDPTNHLGSTDKGNILSQLISNSAQLVFTAAPANTSVIEVRYTIRGNTSAMDMYVANGAQTTFNLTYDPQLPQIPTIYINSVYQSNSAFSFTPKIYGFVERLSNLLSHTNRLSGLESAVYAEDLDLEKVISIGTALNTLANGLDVDSGNNTNSVMYCMSSLFCAYILTSYRNIMINVITPSILSNTTNVVFTTSTLAEMTTGIQNMMDSDLDFYRQVERQVAYSTLSAFITTVYGEPSGQYLIKYIIGTNRLKTILNNG